MVRQFQESYFSNNLQSTVKGYSAPDFSKLAKSYGITSLKIKDNIEEVNSIKKLIDSEGPSLLEILISSESKVYPKLAFGRKFGEMEPDISPKAMEST